MKRVLTATLMALALTSGTAFAADLPSPAPGPYYTKAPPPVSVFSWTGFYLGVDGGYGWGTSKGTAANSVGAFPVPYSYDVDGPLAGGFLGANYQINQFVIGAEADWQWADLTGNSGPIAAVGGPYTMSSTVKDYGSLRGRLGLAMDHWLFFGTGGLAWGSWDTSYGFTGAAPFFTNSVKSHTGWTAGAGIEYAFSDNWIGRVEYRYTDLGTASYVNVAT